jgi:hypothetical protein
VERGQEAAVRFVNGPGDGAEVDLRPARGEPGSIEPLVPDAQSSESLERAGRQGILLPRHPEDAAALELRRSTRATEERLPQVERSHRPSGVDLLVAVAHADDPALSARTAARIGGSVGVDQRDATAG